MCNSALVVQLDRKGLLLSKVYHTAGRQVELPNNGRIVVIHSLVIFLLRGEEGGGGVPGEGYIIGNLQADFRHKLF